MQFLCYAVNQIIHYLTKSSETDFWILFLTRFNGQNEFVLVQH